MLYVLYLTLWAFAEDKIPICSEHKIRFEDYSDVEILKGRPKQLNLKSVKEKKLHFFFGLKPRRYKFANFAGHYRVVKGGCGTMCTRYVAIDLKNGEPYDLGVSASLSARYRRTSSLFVIDPEDEIKKYMDNQDVTPVVDTTYFNFQKHKLETICLSKYKKPAN